MAINIQVEQELHATAQSVKDERGNISLLALSTDAVGIGTTNPITATSGRVLHVDNPNGASVLRLGDGTVNGQQWEWQSTVIDNNGAMNLSNLTNFTNPYTVLANGNVGIGTTNPQERLEVEGNIVATGDVRLAGADCAEEFDIEEGQALEPGTVMVISDEEALHQCIEAYDTKVAGVLSGGGDCMPGIVLGKQSSRKKRKPLALTGKVYCKVDAQYAPINLGDLLTTSPTPGYAMKATDPGRAFGAILGKALRPLSHGQGLIPILVALQ